MFSIWIAIPIAFPEIDPRRYHDTRLDPDNPHKARACLIRRSHCHRMALSIRLSLGSPIRYPYSYIPPGRSEPYKNSRDGLGWDDLATCASRSAIVGPDHVCGMPQTCSPWIIPPWHWHQPIHPSILPSITRPEFIDTWPRKCRHNCHISAQFWHLKSIQKYQCNQPRQPLYHTMHFVS